MAIEIPPRKAPQQDTLGARIKGVFQSAYEGTKNFFSGADRATENLNRTRALNTAVGETESELANLMQNYDRANTKFDKLDLAINSIANQSLHKAQEALIDRGSKLRLSSDYDEIIASKKVQAYNALRADKLGYITTELDNQVKGLQARAVNASPEELPMIQNQMISLLSDAEQAGAITAADKERLISESNETIKYNQFRGMLRTNPKGTLKFMEENFHNLDMSARSISELRRQGAALLKETEVKKKKRTNLENLGYLQKYNAVEEAIKNGEIDTEGLYEVANDLDSNDFERLVKLHLNTLDKAAEEQEVMDNISERIGSGAGLEDIGPAEVTKHYKYTLSGREEPATMLDKAQLVSGYNQPVALFTKELQGKLLNETEDSEQAFQSYLWLERTNPIALDKINSKADNVVAITRELMETTGVDFKQASRKAREQVLDRGPITSIRESEGRKFIKDIDAASFVNQALDNEITTKREKFSLGLFQQRVELAPGLDAKAKSILRQAYLETGDEDTARTLANQRIKRSFGYSNFNKGEIMQYPPEKMFPNLNPDDMQDDLMQNVQQFLPEGVKEVKISSDDISLGITNNGQRSISYLLSYVDDLGIEHPLTSEDGDLLRWQPDSREIINRTQSRQEQINQQRVQGAQQKRDRISEFKETGEILKQEDLTEAQKQLRFF